MQSSKPIIIGIHLKVSSHGGLSLATTPNSSLYINPQTDIVANLRNWATTHPKAIESIPKDISTRYLGTQALPPPSTEFTLIKQLPTPTKQKQIRWVKAQATIMNYNQRFWFLSCNLCHKLMRGERDEATICPRCEKLTHIEPRCRVEIVLEDASGDADALIYGELAEKLLHIKATTLADYTLEENNIVAMEAFNPLTPTKMHAIQFQLLERERRQDTTPAIIVLSVDLEDEEPTNINTFTASSKADHTTKHGRPPSTISNTATTTSTSQPTTTSQQKPKKKKKQS